MPDSRPAISSVRSWALPSLLALGLTTLLACGGGGGGGGDDVGEPSVFRSGATLHIVSGSENKGLEPVIRSFAQDRGANIEVTYLGSVDISLELEKGAAIEYDAVWPANSLWIALGDRDKRVKHEQSIMRSPVVFGVKRSVVERLGWTGRNDIRVADILAAAESGQLRFAMTSATQSNSGASAYFGFLHALADGPEVLGDEHLDDAAVRDKVRRLLGSVDRSSGSSGWLKTMFLDRWPRFDAMVNYEAMVIEANQVAVPRGDEPLVAVYPVDGLTIADSPLGYVDKGDAEKEALFLELQQYLLSSEVQGRIGSLGRRTGLLGLSSNADRSVFNPDWGIDLERIISPVPVPEASVIRNALDLYQTALRKPSLTAYVLDFSGSMEGEGEEQLKDAMATLLDSSQARRYFLQPSENDVHLVIPFDGRPRQVWEARGNDPDTLRQLLGHVLQEDSGGGTDIYAATGQALVTLERYEDQMSSYFPAIILMSDGKSKERMPTLQAVFDRVSFGYDVPIFSIGFGNADPTQLEELSSLTSGRVFDGKKDLVKAFRHAKGYN